MTNERNPDRYATTDGQKPDPNYDGPAPKPINPETGQHESYWVLSETERAKGFVRPVRQTYIHVGCGGFEIDPKDISRHGRVAPGCGAATTMGLALSETYAREPNFYGSTFCVGCRTHFPVNQFKWKDGEVVGS